MKRILLFSGGLDSYAAWHLLGKPTPLYFALGHRYERAERATIAYLERTNPGLDVLIDNRVSLDDIEQPDAHIPLRNALLIALAAATQDPDVIYIGALRGESSRDKSMKFLRITEEMLSFLRNKPIRIEAPFLRLTKADVVKRLIKEKPDAVAGIQDTFSCYTYAVPRSDYKGCGRCMACFRRWVALSLNDISEQYEHEPWAWEQMQTSNWRAGLTALRQSHYSEWPHILINNYQAMHAMKKVITKK